jgi:GTP cyclohydrolase II
VFATENNVRYLRAKAELTGHTLALPSGIAS